MNNGKDAIQARFDRYVNEHPEVLREIVRTAKMIKASGRQHYSIDSILHVVRFHRDLQGTEEGGFKVNNDFSSRWARLIMERYPELDGFFETRALRAA